MIRNCLTAALVLFVQDLALAEETDGIDALKCKAESTSSLWEEGDSFPYSAGI